MTTTLRAWCASARAWAFGLDDVVLLCECSDEELCPACALDTTSLAS